MGQDLGGVQRSDTAELGQGGARRFEGGLDVAGGFGDPTVEPGPHQLPAAPGKKAPREEDSAQRMSFGAPLPYFMYMATTTQTILTAIGGGIAGSFLTYCLSWIRESRRTADAFRTPQRQAIVDILAAAFDFNMQVFELKWTVTDHIRKYPDAPLDRSLMEQLERQIERSMFGLMHAFIVGEITVVESFCWDILHKALKHFRSSLKDFAPQLDQLSEDEPMDQLKTANLYEGLVDQLEDELGKLKAMAQRRLAPPSGWLNKLLLVGGNAPR